MNLCIKLVTVTRNLLNFEIGDRIYKTCVGKELT